MILMEKKLEFHIITMSTYGVGLSGGDRIWIELAKRIAEKHPVHVYLWEEGLTIAKREGLAGVNYVLWSAKTSAALGFFVNYFVRIFIGLVKVLTLKLENNSQTIVHSASEFWQDSFPALILKLKYPKITWIAAWYQTAPNPLIGYREQGTRDNKYFVSAFLYWLAQLPVKPLISHFADFVLVNNDEEKKQFPLLNRKERVLVVLGAVPLTDIKKYLIKHSKSNIQRQFDAVFQGRFHPQKGVVELIEIWKKVVDKKPDSILAMIGDGPLMTKVKIQITKYKLQKNVKLFGYVFDGQKKYSIFQRSKIVVHPAFYDSGGMAAAEAMAFGIPCVGFNLASYKSYYPKGMLKVSKGDLNLFAKKILYLLTNSRARNNLGMEARKVIEAGWTWNVRVDTFLNKIQ